MKNFTLIANLKANTKINLIIDYVNFFTKFEYRNLKNISFIISPSMPFINNFKMFITNHFNIAAQDISKISANYGNHTGEVPAEMLYDLGIKYVILGHYEKKAAQNEEIEIILQKIKHINQYQISPIICIGEENIHDLHKLKDIKFNLDQEIIIAYEPLAAIGSGKVADIENIALTISKIRSEMNQLSNLPNNKVLYGGSVTKNNIYELKNIESLDGFLIGGASLDIEHLQEIIESIIN